MPRGSFFDQESPYLPHCSAEDLAPVRRDHEEAVEGVHGGLARGFACW